MICCPEVAAYPCIVAIYVLYNTTPLSLLTVTLLIRTLTQHKTAGTQTLEEND